VSAVLPARSEPESISPPPPAVAGTAAHHPEVLTQIGLITRQVHDALHQLGVMPKLKEAASGLPDARSRLAYIADKCGDTANRVLNSVEQAKSEQASLAKAAASLRDAIGGGATVSPNAAQVVALLAAIEAARERTDTHLTDIMLAQDFHDLTGQVVAKVVKLAGDIEDQLLKLLIQPAPPGQARAAADPAVLDGPVVDPAGRSDVVANQEQVDDLLASLGF
jgi:chemotaxis protein CheZ